MYLLSIFPFFQGTNELYIVFVLDVVLLGLLFYKVHKNKSLIFTKDIKFIMILVWSLSYLITVFYSTDTELAFLGFLKFFTVPIFLILIMQYKYTSEQREKWFEFIGKIGALMVIIILFVVLLGKKDLFFYQSRLSGFFNYANSFGLFLLIGLISTGFKKNFRIIDFIVMSLLVIGIILTNSRAIMIISFISYIAVIILNIGNRKKGLLSLGILLLIGTFTAFTVGLFGVSNRILTTSGESSEFLLRLLYYKDALLLLSENIFGYGHMAWWYMQEGFQTGVYDTQYIHNGLLQVAVDAGVIPALLIVFVFIKAFFERNRSIRDKILMVIILGHSMIDFNMEFMAITLVLFMTLEFNKLIETKNVLKMKIGIIIAGLIYIFFSGVTILYKLKAYNKVNIIFPYSIALNGELAIEKDSIKMIDISEKLYNKNKYFLNGVEILSQKEQMLNNYEKAYEYELWIINNKKYTMKSYIEYVQFLENAIKYYYTIKDIEAVKIYVERLNQVPERISKVKEDSDELAYRIAHKPRLEIPEEIGEYIKSMDQFIQRYK